MATAPSTSFPLPLRNALAELSIAALDEAPARAALGWLATGPAEVAPLAVREALARRHLVEDDGTLVDVHRPYVERMREHARRGLAATAAFRPAAAGDAVGAAVARAVALWNERLFFEVHEVLEAEWKRATGAIRQALQGVIQIGVALHHHAHGNARGARVLMNEGRERLAAAADALPSLDVAGLLAATEPWNAAFGAGAPAPDERPPRIGRREG